MYSTSQQHRALPPFHSWTIPGHYLACDICREYRAIQAQKAEAEASRVGRLAAINVGQSHINRVLSVSPRLRDPRLRRVFGATHHSRHVTIQVPDLSHPVRTTQRVGLHIGQPSGVLRPGSPSKKRPSTDTSTPEPAHFFVPEQYPEGASDPHSSPQPSSQAAPDFWTANAELIRQGALERESLKRAEAAQAAQEARVSSTNYSSMPGTWPSWADEPDDADVPGVPGVPGTGKRFITFLGDLSLRVFGVFLYARWEVQPAQPVQVPAATQTLEPENQHVPKRPRFDIGLAHTGFSPGPSRPLSIGNAPTPYRVFNGNQKDLNFNYDGHFSLDALYDESDSEDDEENDYPGSPMDIDSPEPVVSYQTEATLAGPHVTSPAAAAARRAIATFARDSPVSKKSPPAIERHYHKDTVDSPSGDSCLPRQAESPRYEEILRFFPDDVVHSLPGWRDEDLPADALKVERLKRELMERLRQEEIATQNANLAYLGVRRPKSALIVEPSPEWVNRATNAPANGTFNPRAVHPDAVELKPRDFGKLVPQTAWLNDDCVHSTLCCLAAYINNKAGVKSKVDPPKCVAISSLYWNAFCGDYKKLYPRPFARKWNMTPQNFFGIDTILIPVNSNAHWTLIIIRPSRKTVSYMDSFHTRSETQVRHTYNWLGHFLGDRFVPDEWDTVEFSAPRQTNAWDCGMFVITNAMCLALGISPLCYNEDKMPLQRLRIASMLLNGGFTGDFDLGNL
ncbi:hypothetical protein F4678DRAFT_466991 [Xylaria arbuscula]|nr:hypothetical protein F4678DRAFT_466991 [Xylaria arbuscula]